MVFHFHCVMVSVLASSAVDCGFIGGVMVSVLASSAVDRVFICGFNGECVRLQCGRSWVHRWCNG
jgi:hypothetical protein